MKVKTLGFLAAAGMILTSFSVWSFTAGPGPSGVELAGQAGEKAIQTTNRPGTSERLSEFTTGSTLVVEGRLGHARLAAETDSKTFLFVNVSADSAAAAGSRSAANLAIVIDRSGSMKGQRLTNAIEAARGMVRRLRDGDVVSVTTYATSAETLVQPTTLDSSSRERIALDLERIQASGNTCISCGIEAGMELLRQRSGMVNRILLLSDGEATAGVRDISGFRKLAERARGMGTQVSSVGVDVDYNERVLSALAQDSNGRHYFVENPAALARAFDQELELLAKTIAKDAEVAIDLAPGVEVEQVFDRGFRREGERVFVPLGTFAPGEDKTVLVSVRVPRGAAGERAIANVRLSFNDLVKGELGSCSGSLAAVMTLDAAQISALDPVISARLGRSETAGTLSTATDLFKAGDVKGARRELALKREQLAQRRATASRGAPAPLASRIGRDFDDQSSALGEAEKNIDKAPAATPTGPPPADTREGKARAKDNQILANPFSR